MRSLLLLILPSLALAAPIGDPTGELILRFEAQPSPDRLEVLAEQYGVEEWEHRRGSWPVYTATLADPSRPARAAEALSSESDVLWADADRAVTPVPDGPPVDDELWPELWHLENVGAFGDAMPQADVNVRRAWEITDGTGVIIAIHDSGVALDHTDLRFAGTGFDIIDSDFVGSWEAHDDGAPHGTAVAGVAGAIGNNGIGVTGVAHGASIFPVRILGNPQIGQSVTYADIYDAFAYSVDSGAAVINNSWGLVPTDCQPIGEIPVFSAAMSYAIEEGRGGLGTTVVWSSGNQGCDGLMAPWHDDLGVVTVGATNDRDELIGYSTVGPQLDVVAPSGGRGGRHVYTTDLPGEPGYSSGDYTSGFSGTSCSAPIVSGVLALMYAANPRLRWDQAEEALCETAVRVSPWEAAYDVAGWDRGYGCGRVDAHAAVAAVSNVAPSAPVWTHPQGSVIRADYAVFSWDAASDADGEPLTYRLELTDAEGLVTEIEGSERRWDGRGTLSAGSTWTARVVALDAYGAGAWSETRALTVVSAPPLTGTEVRVRLPSSGCVASLGGTGGLLLLPLLWRRRR